MRFGSLILSVLSGFDRLRFRGCSQLLNNAQGVQSSYLYQRDLLIKEFPDSTEGQSAKQTLAELEEAEKREKEKEEQEKKKVKPEKKLEKKKDAP